MRSLRSLSRWPIALAGVAPSSSGSNRYRSRRGRAAADLSPILMFGLCKIGERGSGVTR